MEKNGQNLEVKYLLLSGHVGRFATRFCKPIGLQQNGAQIRDHCCSSWVQQAEIFTWMGIYAICQGNNLIKIRAREENHWNRERIRWWGKICCAASKKVVDYRLTSVEKNSKIKIKNMSSKCSQGGKQEHFAYTVRTGEMRREEWKKLGEIRFIGEGENWEESSSIRIFSRRGRGEK